MKNFVERHAWCIVGVLAIAASGLIPERALSAWSMGTPIVTYWNGPGQQHWGTLTAASAQQVANAGFNVTWATTPQEVQLAHSYGLRTMFMSDLLVPSSLNDSTKLAQLDAMIDQLRTLPGHYSYFVRDEPNASEFNDLGALVAHLRARDPEHLALINLFPCVVAPDRLGSPDYNAYLSQFTGTVRPSVLSYDAYQLTSSSDSPHYLQNLALASTAAKQAGIPFVNTFQACAWNATWRVPNANEMRFLANSTLAYGAQGIIYYQYTAPYTGDAAGSSPAPGSYTGGIALADGTPTPLYSTAQNVNPEFVAVAKQFQMLKWIGTYQKGYITTRTWSWSDWKFITEYKGPPGTTTLPSSSPFSISSVSNDMTYNEGDPLKGVLFGLFDKDGTALADATFAFIVNLDYTLSKSYTVTGPGNLSVFDASTGVWTPTGQTWATLNLAPGGGMLVGLTSACPIPEPSAISLLATGLFCGLTMFACGGSRASGFRGVMRRLRLALGGAGITSGRLNACVCILIAGAGSALAVEKSDIPLDAPNDAVMASPAEIQEMLDWATAAFVGMPSADAKPQVKIECRRQDFSKLQINQSCLETPIKIGQQEYRHGLGTHANSLIAVTIPPGVKSFKAMVGIDNNHDTQGTLGTVQFSVEIGGKEVFRTRTLKGGNASVAVDVPISEGAAELVLKVDTTPDGPDSDQADWADAHFVMSDGKIVWLTPTEADGFVERAPPFSFRYDGIDSHEILPTWKYEATSRDEKDRVQHQASWADPKTGLSVTAVATGFKRYPAVEWVLYFENQGKQDTPILENIQALDAGLRTGVAKKAITLHQIVGGVNNERTFLPTETALEAGQTFSMAANVGQPSNTVFPFFNLQYADEGMIVAIGWSGQWAASLERATSGPTRLRAGMEKTNLVLHPGEKIRSPRILLMPWKGDRIAAHQRFRRLLMFHYMPKQDGRPLKMPFATQSFDRYFGCGSESGIRPDWGTEAGQIAAAKITRDLGCDVLWFDAAWFVGGFTNGLGNWYCKPKQFPNGLKPVSDACHQMGLKFLLWFEPERVMKGSQIAREHPEFVFDGPEAIWQGKEIGRVFKLSDPTARRWLTDLLSQRITEYGVDIYRNDFNMGPLSSWKQNDTPDRQGMTEIRYVEGLYAMWDELLARHPGLYIDNCSSGGNRLDLETCMRSVPLWRDDSSSAPLPGRSDWNQTQTYGLSLYLPFSIACTWFPETYNVRSCATAGGVWEFDYLNENFPWKQAKSLVAEIKENQKYWYGDFYPLTRAPVGADQWIAWQYHRPDLNAGLVLAFRRSECPYPVLTVKLGGIDLAKNYTVEFIDDAQQKAEKAMSGHELAAELELPLPKKQSSLLIRYRPTP